MIKGLKFGKRQLILTMVLILSAVLNIWNLGIEGYGNLYYSAAIKSMLLSFKNFFYLSFDPTGYITIDKPPIGLWIQAISAKIFGFSGWSIIFPQAIAGVISVGVLYYLVKKYFGFKAGIMSALLLAITPVFVAASRNNTIDNLLLLTTIIACIPALKACETGKLKYIVISLIWVGIGFNIKMAEALLIVPAIYITYFLSRNIMFKRKVLNLIVGTFVLIAVSLSWGIAVDLTPASNRPYVGSSTTNSELELMIGHNGLQRLGVYSELNGGSLTAVNSDINSKASTNASNEVQSSNNLAVSNSGRGFFRLFLGNSMADQIVWFMPLAIVGLLAILIEEKIKIFRLKFDTTRKLFILFMAMWFVPGFLYFSFSSGVVHTYYLTMLAAPVAVLAGIGIFSMIKLYKEGNIKSIFLIIGFLGTILAQGWMAIHFNGNLNNILRCIIYGSLAVSLISIIIFYLTKNKKIKKRILAFGVIGILITPLIGSGDTLFYAMNGNAAEAGLQLIPDSKSKVINEEGSLSNEKWNENIKSLVSYLDSHEKGEKYLLVTENSIDTSQYAESIIIDYGKSVMALGGFSGADNVVNLNEFKDMVEDGQVKYVLVENLAISKNNQDIINWVKENGKIISKNQWQMTPYNYNNVNLYEV
ncbi:MAG: glycosyltransferase family 39 protein [Clostridium perfringens]|nr:glycosyltransferase family 39 protein [Clostridium perfringens]